MGSIKLINELRFGGVGATRDEGDGKKSAKILKLLQKKTELYIKGERMTEMKLMQLITGSTNQSSVQITYREFCIYVLAICI